MIRDVEYSVHNGQNSQDDNLRKSDVQVGIYLKLLLIKLNPAVFLFVANGWLVCNFKSWVEEILATLEFRIDKTPRLLIIPSLATLPKLIQHSLFINFGGFCQPPLLFQTPGLLIHVHGPQR